MWRRNMDIEVNTITRLFGACDVNKSLAEPMTFWMDSAFTVFDILVSQWRTGFVKIFLDC